MKYLIILICLISCFSQNDKVSLQSKLNINIDQLNSYETGSDSASCVWNKKSMPDLIIHKIIRELINLKVWELPSKNAPAGCTKAYSSGLDRSKFIFETGSLIIPPSGMYPPSHLDTDTNYFLVEWKDEKSARKFCLEKKDVSAVRKKYEVQFSDCDL